MKEYTLSHLSRALGGKALGMSVRETSKRIGVPKSVVGRWFKEPDRARQAMEFKSVARVMRGQGVKDADMKKFQRFKKRIMHSPQGEQRRLTITYNDETGSWAVESV